MLGACSDVIEVNAPAGEPRLVIEGWIYDDRDVQTILLNNSAPYFANGPLPAETGAVVEVTAESGETFTFTEDPAGVYTADFRGETGNEYTLTVETTAGDRYISSPQRLLAVAPLDSAYAVFTEVPDVEEEEDEGYYPNWDFTDPEGTEDFYRWRFYVNDVVLNEPQQIVVFSDEFIDGEELNGASWLGMDPLVEGDELIIEQLSLTEEAYDFFTRVRQITNDVGGLFDTPPDPVRGNLTNVVNEQNYALGFFGASSAVRSSYRVE